MAVLFPFYFKYRQMYTVCRQMALLVTDHTRSAIIEKLIDSQNVDLLKLIPLKYIVEKNIFRKHHRTVKYFYRHYGYVAYKSRALLQSQILQFISWLSFGFVFRT